MNSFTDFQFPIPLQQTLKKMNFSTVTEVQQKSMPIALTSSDLVVCAQTGSGKTLAYSLPMLSKIFKNPTKGGLILAPSRELARQIADVVRPLVDNTVTLKMSVIVGGIDMQKQVRSLKRKPQVIIATPGRLNDHLRRRTVDLSNFEFLVLDEGDRMLDMGFAPQLEEIFKFMPEKRHTMLFTATLPKKVKSLIKDYMYEPEEIIIGERSRPVTHIKQKVIFTRAQEKEDRLVDELNKREGSVIIFAKTKVKTDKLAHFLNEYGFGALRIHGDRSQGQRNQAIDNFRNNKSRILCATDVVARGLDIPHVKHVINFDLPMMDEDFVHRVGRTARNGATGEALSFVTPMERQQWSKIEKKFKLQDVESEGETASMRDGGGSGERSRRDNGGGGERSRRDSRGGGRSQSSKKSAGRSFGSSSKRNASASSTYESRAKSDSRRSEPKSDGRRSEFKSDSKRSASSNAKGDSKKTSSSRSASKSASSKSSSSKKTYSTGAKKKTSKKSSFKGGSKKGGFKASKRGRR